MNWLIAQQSNKSYKHRYLVKYSQGHWFDTPQGNDKIRINIGTFKNYNYQTEAKYGFTSKIVKKIDTC